MADTNSGSLDAGGAHARTGGASAAAPRATTSWAGQAAYQARWGMLVDEMTPEHQTGGGSATAPLAAAAQVKPVPLFPTVPPTGKHCSQRANAGSGTNTLATAQVALAPLTASTTACRPDPCGKVAKTRVATSRRFSTMRSSCPLVRPVHHLRPRVRLCPLRGETAEARVATSRRFSMMRPSWPSLRPVHHLRSCVLHPGARSFRPCAPRTPQQVWRGRWRSGMSGRV
jgi:hypothetical protein